MNLKSEKTLWVLMIAGGVLFGGLCAGISFLPFDLIKPFSDALATDGQFESFTPALQEKLAFIGWSGIAMLGMAIAMGVAKEPSQRIVSTALNWLRQTGLAFINDGLTLAQKVSGLLREKPYTLIFMTLVAGLSRVVFIARPITYDEAYSFNNFAAHSWLRVITDYHLPNNHIFYNLLVHGGYEWFGNHLWVIRLPAFAAGVLMIPAAYLVGRAFFEPFSALLGAALTASISIFLFFSSTGRGYTLICLFTLLLLGLGAYVLRHPNRMAWAWMGVFSVLGFYTIPMMLYPFTALVGWLVFSWVLAPAPRDLKFLKYLAVFLIMTFLMTGLAYLPVILVSGARKLFENSSVAPMGEREFRLRLVRRLSDTWKEWNRGTLANSDWILMGGVAITLLFPRKISPRYPIPFPIIMILTLAGFIWFQQVAPPDRVYVFTLPVFLLWAAAGLAWVVRGTFGRIFANRPAFWKITQAAVLVFCSLVPLIPGLSYQEKVSNRQLYVLEMTLQLKEQLLPGDVVIVAFPLDATIRYYFDFYDVLDDQAFEYERVPIRTAVVIVDLEGQTIESVLTAGKFPNDWLDLASAQPIARYDHVTAYRLTPNYPLPIDN